MDTCTSDSSLINLLISPAVGFTTNSAGDSGGVIDTSDSSFINISYQQYIFTNCATINLIMVVSQLLTF